MKLPLNLPSVDRNELTYWLGLVLLFIGLSLGVSVATAFCVAGGLIVLESLITSYLATWMGVRMAQKTGK